jgi:hypothetical protein
MKLLVIAFRQLPAIAGSTDPRRGVAMNRFEKSAMRKSRFGAADARALLDTGRYGRSRAVLYR